MRIRLLALAVAGLCGIALAAVPNFAAGDSPTSGSFTATDDYWNAAGGGSTVTIAQGGTVTFGYPTGVSMHNADFDSSDPSSCTQTAGADTGSVPPLPHTPTSPGWSGSCTFNQAGTYTFHCDEHPFMTGTVVVQGSGTTTSTTTTTTTTPPGTTSTTPTPGPTSPTPPPVGPTSSPLAGSASQAVHVARNQRGPKVHGTVKVSPAGVGGTLNLTANTAAGRLIGRSSSRLHAGTVSFSVSLNSSARRRLRQQGKLAIELKLVVRATSGRTVRVSRRVALRR